jgi:hypothetical protein
MESRRPSSSPGGSGQRRRLLREEMLVVVGLFVLAFAGFRVAKNREVGDSRYTILLAQTLLHHGDFALDRYHLPETATVEGRLRADYHLEQVGGHWYYAFPAGSSILSVPFVAALNLVGVSATRPDGTYDQEREMRIDVFLANLLMAILVIVVYATARLLLPRPWSALVATIAAFGTQVFSSTSRALWSDTWGMVLIGVCVFLLLRAEVTRGRAFPALLGTLAGWAYWVRPTNALPLAAIAIFLAVTRPRELAKFLGAVALWLAALALYSWHHFHRLLPAYFSPGRLPFSRFFVAMAGNLVSPSRGLLVFVPILIPVGFLIVRNWRQVRHQRLALLSASVVVLHLVLVSGFDHWWGGHSYGARLTAGLLPWLALLGVLAVDVMRSTERARAGAAVVAGVLGATSIFMNSVGAFSEDALRWNVIPLNVDSHPERLWSLRNPQFLAPFLEPAGPFPVMPPAELRLVSFDADKYLGLGWGNPDEDYRWTDGHRATIRFGGSEDMPGLLRLEVKPYLADGRVREQRLEVWINGHQLQVIQLDSPEFTWHEIQVPRETLRRESVLNLLVPDAISPSKIGLSKDRRTLGVAVRALRWSQPGPPA